MNEISVPKNQGYVNGHAPLPDLQTIKTNGKAKAAANGAATPQVDRAPVAPKSSQTGGEAPGHRRAFKDLIKAIDLKARAIDKDKALAILNRDELGGAELLCTLAKGEIVYDRVSGSWYWWNGLHWEEDRGGNIFGLAGDIMSSIYRRVIVALIAEELELKHQIKKDEFADKKEKAKAESRLRDIPREIKSANDAMSEYYKLAYIRNVLVFAGATQLLGVVGDEWDTQTHLLGVKNAVIDLTTGKPVQPDPAQYIRTVAPVDYNPAASCPIWLKAIMEIFSHDPAMVAYIKRFLGYALSGTCQESDFPVWYGKDGRNGKEFLLERIRAVLGGKLTGAVESELLLKSKTDKAKNGATPALMALQGRRIAWASETNEGRHFDNAAMKDLSGGHILTGRHLHKGQVEWQRTHTLIMLTNHKPHVSGGGGGAEWERIKLVPFSESFVSEPDPNDPHQHLKDPTLGERIDRDELPGILNWLIEGCLEWRQNGLQTPAAVKDATRQYRSDEDTLGRFIEDCCVVTRNAKAPIKDLFSAYKDWCYQNNDSAMGAKTFGQKLEDRGHARYKSGGVRGFNGIGLATTKVPLDDK